MVKLYADLVMKDLRTIEQVPPQWREDVRVEVERRRAEAGNA